MSAGSGFRSAIAISRQSLTSLDMINTCLSILLNIYSLSGWQNFAGTYNTRPNRRHGNAGFKVCRKGVFINENKRKRVLTMLDGSVECALPDWRPKQTFQPEIKVLLKFNPSKLCGRFCLDSGIYPVSHMMRTCSQIVQKTGSCIRAKLSTGEFDPGSDWTLAACLTHASRTVTAESLLSGWRVANGWVTRRNLPDSGGQLMET